MGFQASSIFPGADFRNLREVMFDRGLSPTPGILSRKTQDGVTRKPTVAATHDLCQLREAGP
jgi:hypothetical protein